MILSALFAITVAGWFGHSQVGLEAVIPSPQYWEGKTRGTDLLGPLIRLDREAERASGRFKSAAQTDPSGPAPLVQAWKRHSPLRMMDPMPEFHFYEPSKGHGLPHDPFKAIVAPRPIGWISTRDAEGRVNLAPYSFFNAVCDHPPMVMFSSSGWKDTVSNIRATGEFVCNLVTRPLAE